MLCLTENNKRNPDENLGGAEAILAGAEAPPWRRPWFTDVRCFHDIVKCG